MTFALNMLFLFADVCRRARTLPLPLPLPLPLHCFFCVFSFVRVFLTNALYDGTYNRKLTKNVLQLKNKSGKIEMSTWSEK
jgi:hypothetical protein